MRTTSLIETARQTYSSGQELYRRNSSHPCAMFVLDVLAAWKPEIYMAMSRQCRDLWWGQHRSVSEELRHGVFLRQARLWGWRKIPLVDAVVGDALLLTTKGKVIDHVSVVVDSGTHAHLDRRTRDLIVEPIVQSEVVRALRY